MMKVLRFFEDYKALENKAVVVEKFLNQEEALHILKESIDLCTEQKTSILGS